ncbi:MAG TPA: hypothetical protein VGF70_00985, partial [Solirubrobacteraceae bacterium]
AAAWHPSRRWPFPCRVTGADPSSLRPPMILVSFHTGGTMAFRLLFEQLPGKVLALRFNETSVPPPPGVARATTGSGELERIAAAKHAGDALREGGFVFMMLDGAGPWNTPIAAFDRTLFVSSGAFRLARITEAPIVPVIAEWRCRRMEIVLGRPIAPADEETMTARLASWLEGVFPAGYRRSRLVSRLSG